MDKQIITFSANEQNLVRIGGEYHYSSNKVSYIGAHFDLGANWDGFDSVRAVWFTDRINGISTVLDGEGNCTVPTEVLKKKDRVFVNLVGSIVSNGELTDRLTTYPAVALVVDSKAKVDSTETASVTPSQFEQFVSIVQDAVANIKDIVSTTLNADYTLTFVYSDGTSYTTPSIRGERGPQGADGADGTDGNGIASAVLNSNYTLTLTFTDGTSYTTPSIRGAQGPKGDPGDVSQAQLDAAVSDLKSDFDNIAYYETGKNLYNDAVSSVGLLYSDGRVLDSYTDYKTSALIPVTVGDSYTVSTWSAGGGSQQNARIVVAFYSDADTMLSDSYSNQAGINTKTVTAPVSAAYIRVCANETIQVEEGSTASQYEPYKNELLLNDSLPLTSTMQDAVEDAIDAYANNVLYGKKWAHCGDSFSHYTNKSFDSGVFVGKNKTFPRLIALKNNMNLLEDFMLSGRTLAYPADGTFDNSLTAPDETYNYQNIPADADYITIMLGINDCQHGGSTGAITIGTIEDNTTATYYGAWNVVLGWLRENRPFAHIGIFITNGTTRQDYTEAQIAVAKKWGYPYINLNGDERTPAFIRCYNPNVPNALKESLKEIQGVNAPTDTHPNWQTHELESTIIENWLRSL